MFFKAISLLCLCFILSGNVYATSPDLPNLLHKWNQSHNDKASSINNNTVDLLNSIARAYFESVPDSTLYYGQLALNFSQKNKYSLGQVEALSLISRANYIKGDYDRSLSAALQELKISKDINYETGKAASYNSLGLIYLTKDNIAVGLRHFQNAAKINKQLGNLSKLAANYVNIGICFSELKQYDSAISPLLKSLKLSRSVNDYHLIALANNRLGEVYLTKGRQDDAIRYFESVVTNTSYVNDWENSFAYTGLANANYTKQNYAISIDNGQKALSLGKKINANYDIERALYVLYKSYAAINNYHQAFIHLELNKKYSELLFNEKSEKEVNALNLKQEQIENQDLIKKDQINQQKIEFNSLIIVGACLLSLFLLVIIFLIYRNYLIKSKANKKLQLNAENIARQHKLIVAQNEELSQLNYTKDQLFSVIGHDLRNPFASIIQTMQLIKDNDLSQEEIAYVMDKFFEKITVTAAMLDNLLLWANSQQNGIRAHMTAINLSIVINQLLNLLKLIAVEKKITIHHNLNDDAIINADIDHIRVIFQNIIGNAIKFTPEHGDIEVFYKIDEVFVEVHIKDSGVGIATEKLALLFTVAGQEISTYGTQNEKGIGIGLMLVNKFVQENNATLNILSEEGKGTEFIICFKRVIPTAEINHIL
jgi:signal transduction histidine kinase